MGAGETDRGGLPIAFKVLMAAVGFPFTRGSPIFKDDMPSEDAVLVERLRKAGAIPIRAGDRLRAPASGDRAGVRRVFRPSGATRPAG